MGTTVASPAVKERGILMTGPMSRATWDRRKSMTRRTRGLKWINESPYYKDRVGKIELREGFWHFWDKQAGPSALPIFSAKCPYGAVGDRLWVRETWGCPSADHPKCKDGRKPTRGDRIVYQAKESDAFQWRGGPGCSDFVWRPSLLMPRWASRMTLELTSIRIQRLRQISEEDARLEGAEETVVLPGNRGSFIPYFRNLWEEINGVGSWERNDWLWVLGFKLIGGQA